MQAIRSYVRDRDPEQVRSVMGSGAANIAEIVSDVSERLPGLGRPPALEPDQGRFRLFDSIAAFLKTASQRQPLVLMLDDLHWADKPSLLLLEFLARELAGARLLVIGTYRDMELNRQHPLAETLGGLNRERLFQRVLLRGLAQQDVGRFIEIAAGITPPGGLVEAVHAHTEGNPLFVTEVVRLLVQEGELTPERLGKRGSWRFRIPEGVREVIGRRLNRLSQRCNETLTIASVIGRQFEFRQLAPLVEDMSDDRLLGVLEEALGARVIEEPPQTVGRYQFTYALVQDTLAQELSTTRRVRLHARIAQALEELYGEDAGVHAGELARHFAEAQTVLGTEKLVRYSLLAGERALAAFAYERALGHFQRALAAKEGQPVDAETAALLVGLGRSQMALLDDEAYSTLRRALDYYADSGDLEQVVAIAEFPDYGAARRIGLGQLVARALPLVPADSLQSGRLLSRYGQFIGLQDAAFDEALDALNQAIVISRREGDEALELQSLVALASVYSNHMRYDEALDSGLQAIELTKRVPDPRSEVSALYFVVTCLIEKGELEAAKRHASEMLPPAEQLRDRFWLEGAFGKNAMTLRLAGEWEMARSFSQRTLEIGSRPFHSWVELALIEHETGDHHQGNLHLDLLSKASDEARESAFMNTSVSGRMALIAPLVGRITGVVGHLESAKNAAERVLGYAQATPLAAGYSNAGLAMIAVLSGDADLAGKQYAAIKPWRHTFSLFVISADRLLGLLAQIMGKLDQAIIHFDDALIFCRKGGYRPELAWTCCDYADVLRVRDTEGDRAKAIALLDESLAISSNLGMRPLMERVLARKLELQGVASVDIRTSIDAVASAVSIERPDLRHHSAPDGTVTILFSDIEGFTPHDRAAGRSAGATGAAGAQRHRPAPGGGPPGVRGEVPGRRLHAGFLISPPCFAMLNRHPAGLCRPQSRAPGWARDGPHWNAHRGVRPGNGGLLWQERNPGVAHRGPGPRRGDPGVGAAQRTDGECRRHPVRARTGGRAEGTGRGEPGARGGLELVRAHRNALQPGLARRDSLFSSIADRRNDRPISYQSIMYCVTLSRSGQTAGPRGTAPWGRGLGLAQPGLYRN